MYICNTTKISLHVYTYTVLSKRVRKSCCQYPSVLGQVTDTLDKLLLHKSLKVDAFQDSLGKTGQ